MSLCGKKAEPEIETKIIYSVPEVYFPAIPDFVVFYNLDESEELPEIESVTILWDEWKKIEEYFLLTENAIEALYDY